MCAGSFQGTRTSGTVLVVEMPCSIVTIVWYSIMPCCMSTTSESQPAWAMTSAEKPAGMPSQLLTTALPSAQISLIRFARAILSSAMPTLTLGRDPASYGGGCQAPSPARCSRCFYSREISRRPPRPARLFLLFSAGEEQAGPPPRPELQHGVASLIAVFAVIYNENMAGHIYIGVDDFLIQ